MNQKVNLMEINLIDKITLALEDVRSYLKNDGGDVKVVRVTDDLVVEVELIGNCETCSMNNFTMKAGIEQVIKKAVPEIKEVIAINAIK